MEKLDIGKLKNVPSVTVQKVKWGKLDIGKLVTTSVNLGKLSNLVKSDVVKKTENMN